MTAPFPLSNTRRLVLFGLAAGAAQVAGCGGGGGDLAGIGSGGTGSFTTGVITGLGSIIVNGVRYDDSGVTPVADDDSTASRSALVPGMVVTVEGSGRTPATKVGGLPKAVAYRITYGSEWKGPVAGIARSTTAGVTTGTFTMLGQPVAVSATTIFTGLINRFDDLSDDDSVPVHYVEAYGFVDQTTGQLQATLIEVKSSLQEYKLSGKLTAFDRTGATALLGPAPSGTALTMTWTGADVAGENIGVGTFVRIRLNPTPVSAGVYTATKIRRQGPRAPETGRHERYDAELEGVVTDFVSPTLFSVNGVAVNATQARIEGTVAAGVRVEAKGRVENGVLIATEVEVKTAESIREEDSNRDFEFHGSIVSVTPSGATSGSFVLRPEGAADDTRNQTITYDNLTDFDDGATRASLTVGASLEVKAVRAGAGWRAVKIELDD